MKKEEKWKALLLQYAQDKKLMSCPECGKDEMEVIVLPEGRGSTTFHCKSCNVFRHYDGQPKE